MIRWLILLAMAAGVMLAACGDDDEWEFRVGGGETLSEAEIRTALRDALGESSETERAEICDEVEGRSPEHVVQVYEAQAEALGLEVIVDRDDAVHMWKIVKEECNRGFSTRPAE